MSDRPGTVGGPLAGTLAPLAGSVPVVSMAARTREAEARSVVAAVSGLLDRGVSPSDVTVVARDVDAYEEPLRRAARRYALTLSVWTQIRLKRTVPCRLTGSVVDLLAAREQTGGGPLAADTVLDPLRFEWIPPGAAPGGDWPLDPALVDAVARDVAGETHTIDGWRARLGDEDDVRSAGVASDGVASAGVATDDDDGSGVATDDDDGSGVAIGSRLVEYLDWVAARPATPSPVDVPGSIGPVLDAYREVVMPRRRAADDPTLSATATTARALARMEELTLELAEKYDAWLADGYGDRSWTTVAELLDAIASTVPGRREYATARSVDVMEANDVWGLDLTYVVAVGLVDGEWPRSPESTYPAALRERLRSNEGPAAALRPRSGWTEAGELDQFADAVAAAGEGLICTRFTTDGDGVEVRPSPYLRALDPEPIGSNAADRLVGEPHELPARIAAMAGARSADESTAPTEGPER